MGAPSGGLRRLSRFEESRKDIETLTKELKEDKTISEATRRELLAELPELTGGPGDFAASEALAGDLDITSRIAKARETLEEARKGTDPKFRARQIAARSAELRADRPGLLQTRGRR